MRARVVALSLICSAIACTGDERTDQHISEAVVASGGVPRGSSWSYWDRGGDLGTAWRGASFDDSSWARGAGPLGYGESYLATTVGYGTSASNKHITTYFRTQFTVDDPAAVRAMQGALMYDDGAVVYLNGIEVARVSMPTGTISATTRASGHEANGYQTLDWTAHRGLLRAGVNTIAVEVHQAEPSSSDLVFDLGLTLETAPTASGIARRSMWRYWDRGGDLGTGWRAGSFDDTAWARGAGPLGYGESYLGTTISYGSSSSSKHITSYFRAQFSVDDPAAVQAMVGELMYDDGAVVYLNGTEIARASMPGGTITASTLALGHEANNAYVTLDWTAHRGLLRAGVNTIAVEIHQLDRASSDLVFDLALALSLGPSQPRDDDIPRGSTWAYWDGGGDLGTAWRSPSYDDRAWRRGAAPLGYGESVIATQLARGHITTYFRAELWVDDPDAITRMNAHLLVDDGVVIYVNGVELVRHWMPGGTIAASTRAVDHEIGGGYEHYWYHPQINDLLVPGRNVIAAEVHQASSTSSDLVFDLALLAETSTREPTERGIPEGSTWGYWDRGGDLGTAWRQPDYEEVGWKAGSAPLGFGESYIATATTPGHVTTYFRHDFYPSGSPTDWVLEARYDDGFIAYLNGVEVLRVGLPAGTVTASTSASGHEAGGYERFPLPDADALIRDGLNTLAIEVHQAGASSSDLVWDARLVRESQWPLTWTRQNSGVTQHLADVWFADASHGWVVGANGAILRTVDGGATWTADASIDSVAYLREVEFADLQHGWIAGPDTLLATTNGGVTWFVQSTLDARSLDFLSATTGYLTAGDGIYRTVDGGASWQLLYANPLYRMGQVDFLDATHGWATAELVNDDGDVVLRTRDGGLTWEQQLRMGGDFDFIASLDAVSTTFAAVGGGGWYKSYMDELIAITRDGTSWTTAPESSNGTYITDLQFFDPSNGVAVGWAGSILRTTDGGATWTVDEVARYYYWLDYISEEAPSLSGVHMLDPNTGWAVGDRGTIVTLRR